MRIFAGHIYLFGTLIFIGFLIILGAGLFHSLEYAINPSVNEPLDSLWWAVNTLTTTGAGDVIPVTKVGRVIGMVLMSAGILSIGVLSASLASTIVGKHIEKEKEDKFPN